MGVNIIDPITGNPLPVDGMRTIEDCKQLILEFCYPVGSFYISTKNVSPQNFLGGTWESRSGYMLRAATSDVTFDKANDTNDGGADSVTVSSVASHNHTQNSHTHAFGGAGDSSIVSGNMEFVQAGASRTMRWGKTSNHQYGRTGTNAGYVNDTTATNKANGANYTVNTLPKYKNVYIWERTA